MAPAAIIFFGIVSVIGVCMIGYSLQQAKTRGVHFSGLWAPASAFTAKELRFNRYGFAISLFGVGMQALLIAYIRLAA